MIVVRDIDTGYWVRFMAAFGSISVPLAGARLTDPSEIDAQSDASSMRQHK